MVDKENQWDDDIEYTDIQDSDNSEMYEDEDFDSSEDAYDEQSYSEEDYDDEAYDDEYEDGEEYDSSAVEEQKKKNIFPVLLIVLLLLGVGSFFIISSLSNKEVAPKDNVVANVSQTAGEDISFQGTEFTDDQFFSDGASDMNTVSFGDDANVAIGDIPPTTPAPSVNDAQVAPDSVSSEVVSVPSTMNADNNVVAPVENKAPIEFDFPSENPPAVASVPQMESAQVNDNNDLFAQAETPIDPAVANENNDIIVSYDKVARLNPFKPPVFEAEAEIAKTYGSLNNTDFEIVEPPSSSVPDENLTKLLQTQVSGILYDEESPSAIVNLNGVDTFVKAGDVMSGYKIQTITRDKVQINYKNNSYVASVGALFVKGMVESRPAVANLEKKFAGRYKEDDTNITRGVE